MTNTQKHKLENQKVSLPTERSIVSYLFSNPNVVIINQLKPEYFLDSQCSQLFSCLEESVREGKDVTSVMMSHKVPDAYALRASIALWDKLLVEQRVRMAVEQLKLSYKRDKMYHMILSLIDYEINEPDAFLSQLQNDIFSIMEEGQNDNIKVEDFIGEYEAARKEYADKKLEGKKYLGYETGFPSLDDVIDGLRAGHFWIVGAYTSLGKTFWALNVAGNLMKQGVKVSIFSLEMSKVDIFGRLLGILSGVNSNYILKAAMKPEEVEKVDKIKDWLVKKSGLLVHTKADDLDQIMLHMLEENIRKTADVFIIDYGQLISTGDDKQYESMRQVAKKLQRFAQRNKVPIIMLSQVSNEHAKNPEEGIIGFKGAGDLAASADLAIELVSGEKDKERRMEKFASGQPVDIKACIKKNRHGRIAEVNLLFHGRTGKFEEGHSVDEEFAGYDNKPKPINRQYKN